jgi:hydroxyacylglutathione hydrolase
MKNLSIEIFKQLTDNYSYLIFKENNPSAIVIDPAESRELIIMLKEEKLNLDYIFITHNHSDHTSGIEGLLKEYPGVKIFSPSNLYSFSVHKILDSNKIKTSINEFEIISTPGHTLDHVVLHDKYNKLLFVGDTLFRLGCGRIFEGSFEQMQKSLDKIFNLSDELMVYCGHEYTKNNLKFLESIFVNNLILNSAKKHILNDLNSTGRSIPFKLRSEKKCNPFLNQNCETVTEFRKNKKYSNLEFFRYLREKKDNF